MKLNLMNNRKSSLLHKKYGRLENICRVTQEITFEKAGQIFYEGVLWRALAYDNGANLKPGEKARIMGRQSTSLIVEPLRYD